MNYKENPGKYHASESNKEWYAQRNSDMFKDKLAGMSGMKLIEKYRLTPARIKFLIKNERKKNGRNNDVSVS
jgi:Mor family transcriptional regulator